MDRIIAGSNVKKVSSNNDPTRKSIMDELLKETLEPVHFGDSPAKQTSPLKAGKNEISFKKKTEEDEDVLENVLKSYNNEYIPDPDELIKEFEETEKVNFFNKELAFNV